jgi:hypothetical protein
LNSSGCSTGSASPSKLSCERPSTATG